MRLKPMIGLLIAAAISGEALADCSTNRNANIAITKPDGIYIDQKDGTVIDIETGLMWQKCALGYDWGAGTDANDFSDDTCTASGNPATFTWGEALAAADADSFVDANWRLPNDKELESLVEDACFNPNINEALFPATVSEWHWSASAYVRAGFNGYAWAVYFKNGDVGVHFKSVTNSVRLVRASQSL